MSADIHPIVIVGAGGHGREVLQLIAQINRHAPSWQVLGFLDDAPSLHGGTVAGLPVLGGTGVLDSLPPETHVALGVGSPRIKRAIVSRLGDRPLPVLVHPSVIVGERLSLGAGTQLHAGCILTCDIRIGRAVTVNRRCDISHDDVIDDFVTLAPSVSLAGNVHIGHGADIGIAACCIPGVHVGEDSVVGAGAVVISDIPASATAVGVPARTRPAPLSPT